MKVRRLRYRIDSMEEGKESRNCGYMVFHRSSPQTATEGRMVKVLPERVPRSGTAVVGACADEEGCPNADEGGRPRALLTAGGRTSVGCSFLGRPRFGV